MILVAEMINGRLMVDADRAMRFTEEQVQNALKNAERRWQIQIDCANKFASECLRAEAEARAAADRAAIKGVA